jgi:hypothetical protein
MTQENESPYCENCFKEHLEHYVIDSLGNVFCSLECCLDSQEWREVDVESLTIVTGC